MTDVGDEVIDSVRVGVLYSRVTGEKLSHVYVPVRCVGVWVCVCGGGGGGGCLCVGGGSGWGGGLTIG